MTKHYGILSHHVYIPITQYKCKQVNEKLFFELEGIVEKEQETRSDIGVYSGRVLDKSTSHYVTNTHGNKLIPISIPTHFYIRLRPVIMTSQETTVLL